jgi:hypothetical protein
MDNNRLQWRHTIRKMMRPEQHFRAGIFGASSNRLIIGRYSDLVENTAIARNRNDPGKCRLPIKIRNILARDANTATPCWNDSK